MKRSDTGACPFRGYVVVRTDVVVQNGFGLCYETACFPDIFVKPLECWRPNS